MKITQPELVCPAGSLPALKAAIDNGADTVYIGLRGVTNIRNFAGLNFDSLSAMTGISYAHQRGKKVLLAVNTYAQAGEVDKWYKAIDQAVTLGVDGVILADMGLLDYARHQYPDLKLHLSVQSSVTNYEAINLACELFHIQRITLPSILTIEQVERIIKNTSVEVEIFGFGSLCTMVDGRCLLSSYMTGESPNAQGICSAIKLSCGEKCQTLQGGCLNHLLMIPNFVDEPVFSINKDCFAVNQTDYLISEGPYSLNIVEKLPELIQLGVAAIKVEGRQRNINYIAQVTKVLRGAIDLVAKHPVDFIVKEDWHHTLIKLSKEPRTTTDLYNLS